MASDGGDQKRCQGHSFGTKGEILDDVEKYQASSLDDDSPCVTQAQAPDYPSETSSDATSAKTRAQSETTKDQNEDTTKLEEATEGGSSVETCSVLGTGRQCVRTVAETPPMPDLFAQDEDGDTFLHVAIVQGDQPLTDFFIQKMKSKGLDIYNKLRQTPLHLAVITHQIHMVRQLIEGGADVNLMDRHGQTPLHLACQDDDVNCVHAIRDVANTKRVSQIRLELKNSQGLSVIHVATLKGSKNLIATILDMGANVNEQDSNSGRTPLHHAVEAGKQGIAEFLISRGADVNKKTFAGNTALHTASGRDMEYMVKLLMQNGANVNIANREGDIPRVVRTSEQVKRQFQSKEKDFKRRKR